MTKLSSYTDLRGQEIPLAGLDEDERRLIAGLRRRAAKRPQWPDFENYWLRTVAAFYEGRGLARPEVVRTAGYRIAQDLSGRLAIAAGTARPPDYRDELAELIRTRFQTRRAFCEATGLAEDMLSHVLAGRKHLAIDTLGEALGRIGYTIRLLPTSPEVAAEGNGTGEHSTKKKVRRATGRAIKRPSP